MTRDKYKAQIVILAGGLGTRLASVTSGLPKPMADLAGYSLIEHQIKMCASLGFKHFAILASYKSDLLYKHIMEIDIENLEIDFLVEMESGGTGGALIEFSPKLHDTIIVLYADTYITVNLNDMLESHVNSSKINSCLASLLVHPNSHPHDSDLISVDNENWITEISGYPHTNINNKRNLVNAALFIINNKDFIKLCRKESFPKKIDLAKDIFPHLLKKGAKLKAIHNRWFIKDCGTPERLLGVTSLIQKGHLSNAVQDRAQPVVFIDRDGCVNKEVGHISTPEQLTVLPEAAEGIKKINSKNIPVICVTNQPVVSRGDATYDDLSRIHSKLDFELGAKGAFINELIFCPHHPDNGYPGEVPELKINCDCRKPKVGMAIQACKKFKIDFSYSWMIGDTTTDLKFSETLGMNSILVRTGFGGNDRRENCLPDFIFEHLGEAANFIVEEYPKYWDFIKNNMNLFLNQKIILIGGKSMSGKSTFSKVLEKFLRAMGESVVSISADEWMSSFDIREQPNDVYESFNLNAFHAFLNKLLNEKKPLYESLKYRHPSGVGEVNKSVTILNNDKIIIDGTATCLLNPEKLSQLFFVWVQTDQEVRKQRFNRRYALLGDKSLSILKKYKKQILDEDKELSKAKFYANLTWSG